MLDTDLAALYGVPTKRLNEQVKRSPGRFPGDFVFALTRAERDEVVANCDHLQRLKFSPTMPFAFTEHGALMAASVLNTPRAACPVAPRYEAGHLPEDARSMRILKQLPL